jgi:hypothetical protein
VLEDASARSESVARDARGVDLHGGRSIARCKR